MGRPALLVLVLCMAGCTDPDWPREPCPAEWAAQGCGSRITEASARAIAREEGLGPGIQPWTVEFSLNADGGFRWGVSNTTHDASDPSIGLVHRGGTLVSIHAEDGRVEGVYGWGGMS